MADVGEAQITRLTRERLAAIKKNIPMRASFRDNLQTRQQQRIEFATDTEQLFKSVTTATEKVVTATEKVGVETEKVGTETEKIEKRTKKIKVKLKTLSGDIVAAQPVPVDVLPAPVNVQPGGGRDIPPNEIFSPATLKEIKSKDNINDLARYAADTMKKVKDN